MTSKTLNLAIAAALFGTLALVGCKKKADDAATTPTPTETAPAPAPAETAPPPAATPAPAAAAVTVTSVDLGNAVGADKKVATPTNSFAKTDKIIAAVSTTSTDTAAASTGKLGAKWTFQEGQVVNEESKDFNFTGTGVTNFEISKPDGWPVGKYKVEISLDGNVVQSKDFEIK